MCGTFPCKAHHHDARVLYTARTLLFSCLGVSRVFCPSFSVYLKGIVLIRKKQQLTFNIITQRFFNKLHYLHLSLAEWVLGNMCQNVFFFLYEQTISDIANCHYFSLLCFLLRVMVIMFFIGDVPLAYIVDPANRTAWIQEKVQLAKRQFMDGINIDVEQAVETSSPEYYALTALVKETTESFHTEIPGSQVKQHITGNCVIWLL